MRCLIRLSNCIARCASGGYGIVETTAGQIDAEIDETTIFVLEDLPPQPPNSEIIELNAQGGNTEEEPDNMCHEL